MSSCPSLSVSLLLLLILSLAAISQQQQQNSPPTMADCGPRLLPLVPCAPFMQGTASTPTQPCCDSLNQLYTEQPTCLCLLLNTTSLTGFPINTTLALELPSLCSLQAQNHSICSGVSSPGNPPASQIPSGPQPDSPIAASPVVTVTPKTSIMGISRSEGTKLRIKDNLMVLVVAYIIM